MYKNSNKLNEKLFGKVHSSYLKGLYVLSNLYETMHIYKSSELLLLEALDVQLKLNGMIHFQYVDLLIRLARLMPWAIIMIGQSYFICRQRSLQKKYFELEVQQ